MQWSNMCSLQILLITREATANVGRSEARQFACLPNGIPFEQNAFIDTNKDSALGIVAYWPL